MVATTEEIIPRTAPVDSSLLDALRTLIEGNTELQSPTDEKFLLRFLWASDLDVKKSYHLIQEYFAARRDFPEVFLLSDPHVHLSIFQGSELGFELRNRDSLGRRMFVARIGDLDPSRHKFEDILQSCLMAMEALSVEADVQKLGVVVVVDITRFSYKLVRWLTPYKMKVSLKFLQDCIPLKMQAFHCVNAPRVFSLTYNAVKPLMKEEFRKKIFWHNGNLSTLHAIIPPDNLPNEFGGSLDPPYSPDWYEHVLQKAPMFKELRSYGYISSKTK